MKRVNLYCSLRLMCTAIQLGFWMFVNASRLLVNWVTTGQQLVHGTHFAVALSWLMTLVDLDNFEDAVLLFANSDNVAEMFVIAYLVDFRVTDFAIVDAIFADFGLVDLVERMIMANLAIKNALVSASEGTTGALLTLEVIRWASFEVVVDHKVSEQVGH